MGMCGLDASGQDVEPMVGCCEHGDEHLSSKQKACIFMTN